MGTHESYYFCCYLVETLVDSGYHTVTLEKIWAGYTKRKVVTIVIIEGVSYFDSALNDWTEIMTCYFC